MSKNKILLKDILRFEDLHKEYPKKRIKLRFNTSWDDFNDRGEKVHRDYLQLYKSNDEGDNIFFRDSILSIWSSKKSRIQEQDIIFQFIEIEQHKWILVDVANILDTHRENKGYNTITKKDFEVANAESISCYEPYYNRLIVNWKNINESFYYVKKGIIDSVEVQNILEEDYRTKKYFVGYDKVCKSYKELKMVIEESSWKEALSNVYGVYAITDRATGKIYIGSSTGDGGIYSRWLTYVTVGYDKEEESDINYPNKGLQELVKEKGIQYIQEKFQYSIIEIFPKNELGKSKALERESYWKEVFQTRIYGYNKN